MEIKEFERLLSKAEQVVEIGIKKGYFEETRKEELTKKLATLFNNGIVYDIPGRAIYGRYSPSERKLYFNVKVFQSEEEALVYILHEIKHGLDHYDDQIGFEYHSEGTGINEGATQRFATDIAEEILQIKFQRETRSSLGINLKTHLDEYQIEDRLNELFCIALGISMEEFIKMQNDPQKEKFKIIIAKFNQYASFEVFKKLLDKIYKIQEKTWVDANNNLLEEEKEPTPEQTQKAIDLINQCKRLLIQYAKKANPKAVEIIEKESFIAKNKCGEIIRVSDVELDNNQESSKLLDELSDLSIISQSEYLDYQKNILSQIISKTISNDCDIVFVTGFGYGFENDDIIVYFRKGDYYLKLIIPMNNDGTMDLENFDVQKVNDINEIKEEIEDCEYEFGIVANGPEYAKILQMCGEELRAKSVIKKWDYYLSRQDELAEIIERVSQIDDTSNEELEQLAEVVEEGRMDLLAEQEISDTKITISYNSIIIDENGILFINPYGGMELVAPEDEEKYLSQVREAVASGELLLTQNQLKLLESFSNNMASKKG